ncbi:MAG TPA: FHA domain-containing protein [Polyangiales bacterium]|nr:FHA domain-containing protein [Polyangiales bacterium]
MTHGPTLKFTLMHPDGRVEQLAVDADLALVGSGAHCEIRLPYESAAVEQLRIEARGIGLFAASRSMDPPTLLNGVPFTEGRLLPGSVLTSGGIQIRVELDDATGVAGARGKTKESSNPLVYGLAIVGLPLGFYLFLTMQTATAELPAAVDPPSLWAEAAEGACSERAADTAHALAERESLRAEAARERSPFHPEEGLHAVALFQRASACYRVAGELTRGEHAQRAALELKRRAESDFHVHHVRLGRALATKHYDRARREVGILLEFVGKRGGRYAEWLTVLDRTIELKFSGKKS